MFVRLSLPTNARWFEKCDKSQIAGNISTGPSLTELQNAKKFTANCSKAVQSESGDNVEVVMMWKWS